VTDLSDVEVQRARWRRSLQRYALDTVDRDDFTLAGLCRRLRTPSAQLLLLPGDPEADAIQVDDEFWAWAKNFSVVNLEGGNVRLGTQHVPTAHAAAIVDAHGGRELWNSYVAIHRSGALEYGLGDRGAWERKDRDGNLVRVFNLISIVARTWALLKFGTALRDRTAVDGPFQLTLALHTTGGAFLGDVAEGWAEPLTWENELLGCPEEHLLWHIELPEWPDEPAMQDIAFSVGDRLEDAWGVLQRRYLARVGDRAGRFDVYRLRE
jgi:hypothetical protein